MRVGVGELAAVLARIAAPANRRDRPLPGDRPGDFAWWFDGGAVEELTGETRYHLDDGTVVSVGVLPATLSVRVTFADGGRVRILQD
jgi:hypothetical protein